jgi:hypothetical protein
MLRGAAFLGGRVGWGKIIFLQGLALRRGVAGFQPLPWLAELRFCSGRQKKQGAAEKRRRLIVFTTE